MTDHRTFRLIARQSEMVVFGTQRQHIPSISAAECRCRELIPRLPLTRQGVHFHFITPQWSEPASVLLTTFLRPGQALGRCERSLNSPELHFPR